MILEDAHWADPTSLEVFSGAVDQTRARRALLIITFQPEFEPPWIGQPHVSVLTLNRLTRRGVDTMIDRIIGNRPLPANVRQHIIERTDGIPLFVEEMTKAVLETESESEAQRTAAAIPFPAQAVPATLHASLMARLDRLGAPAKEVAQIGATIGREFSHTLPGGGGAKAGSRVGGVTDRTIAADLLFRQGVPPHATYLFKHVLVQDAAYGTLLREPRRALHARIAKTLESQFPEVAENQPEVLARHCTEAGQIEKAAGLWGKAGQRSLARAALVEAIEQFRRALDQIATLPSTPALRRTQINLQVAVITPLVHVKGYAAPEAKAAVERARLLIEQAEALGEPSDDPLQFFAVLFGFFVSNILAFNGDVCRDIATQFLGLAEKQAASFPRVMGQNLLGATLTLRGEFAEGRAHLDRGIALYDPPEHRSLAIRFAEDQRVVNLFYRSKALWALGYPNAARVDVDLALEDARESPISLFLALTGAFFLDGSCGDYTTANARNDELVALSDEKGVAFWKSTGMFRASLDSAA